MQNEERKQFIHDAIGKCELCGRIAPCEVHHKKPLSLGGTNDIDNLIYICFDCHNGVHKENRSEMVKAGMRKQNNKEFVVGYYELYAKILLLIVNSNGRAKADEVIEILNNIGVRKNHRKNSNITYEKYREALDIFNEWVESDIS